MKQLLQSIAGVIADLVLLFVGRFALKVATFGRYSMTKDTKSWRWWRNQFIQHYVIVFLMCAASLGYMASESRTLQDVLDDHAKDVLSDPKTAIKKSDEFADKIWVNITVVTPADREAAQQIARERGYAAGAAYLEAIKRKQIEDRQRRLDEAGSWQRAMDAAFNEAQSHDPKTESYDSP